MSAGVMRQHRPPHRDFMQEVQLSARCRFLFLFIQIAYVAVDAAPHANSLVDAQWSAETMQTLDQAAGAFQQFQNVHSGTNSTAGKPCNLRHLQSRLDAVMSSLQAKGIAANALEARAFGEAQLPIEVGDNTAEPRNHRLEISIQEKAKDPKVLLRFQKHRFEDVGWFWEWINFGCWI